MMQSHFNQALINKTLTKMSSCLGYTVTKQKRSFHIYVFLQYSPYSTELILLSWRISSFGMREGGGTKQWPSLLRSSLTSCCQRHPLAFPYSERPNEMGGWNENLSSMSTEFKLKKGDFTFCTNWGFTVISWSIDFSFSSSSIHFSIYVRVKGERVYRLNIV